jgi:hypothetical protein
VVLGLAMKMVMFAVSGCSIWIRLAADRYLLRQGRL